MTLVFKVLCFESMIKTNIELKVRQYKVGQAFKQIGKDGGFDGERAGHR
jgi:hypothetical protein